jgi:hypothetical protein
MRESLAPEQFQAGRLVVLFVGILLLGLSRLQLLVDATDGTIAVGTDTGARIIDLEAYKARRRATVKSSQPLSAGPAIFPVAFYCFWPAILWVPVLSGANQDVRDR